MVDYRISGRTNKTQPGTKIFVSRGPIKPISASGMCIVRPRENSFDYFSANYAMVHWLRLRNFRYRNCASVGTGNEFPTERIPKKYIFRVHNTVDDNRNRYERNDILNERLIKSQISDEYFYEEFLSLCVKGNSLIFFFFFIKLLKQNII